MGNMTTIRYRRRLAISWFVGVGILFLQILLQYIGTVYQGYEQIPWVWFFSVTLPGSIAIGSLYVWTKQLRQQIDPVFFRIVFIGSVIFIIIALVMTFLKLKFSSNEKFIFFIRDSKMFLVPIGLVLTYMIVAGFFKRKGKTEEGGFNSTIGVVDYTINATALKMHAPELKNLLQESESKVGAGKSEKVFKPILVFFAKVGIDDQEVIQLKNQWKTIERNLRSNFITMEEASTRKSRVTAGLLRIISHLEKANKI